MKTKSWILMGGLVVLLGAFAWIFLIQESGTYAVKDGPSLRFVELLNSDTIADVHITPTKERLHLDLVYTSGQTRHTHIDTKGRGVIVSNFRLRPQTVNPDHLVDALGTHWERWKDIRLLGDPTSNETLEGFLSFDPKDGMCIFIWGDQHLARGVWQRKQ